MRTSKTCIKLSQASSKINLTVLKLTALDSRIFTVTTVVFSPSIGSTLRYVTFITLASQIIQPYCPVTRTKMSIGVKWTEKCLFKIKTCLTTPLLQNCLKKCLTYYNSWSVSLFLTFNIQQCTPTYTRTVHVQMT